LKIAGSAILPVPRDRAWELLQDPVAIARAIPGCESLELIGDHEYAMRMKMALASLSGAFEGKVRLTDPNPPDSFKMVVEGKGKIGFMKGEGVIHLIAKDESQTEVTYEGDANIGGPMAAVGQRLIDTTSRMMIRKFFEKVASA
jgi:carbon monoxide dehydrogenase subunit G